MYCYLWGDWPAACVWHHLPRQGQYEGVPAQNGAGEEEGPPAAWYSAGALLLRPPVSWQLLLLAQRRKGLQQLDRGVIDCLSTPASVHVRLLIHECIFFLLLANHFVCLSVHPERPDLPGIDAWLMRELRMCGIGMAYAALCVAPRPL